MTGEDRKAYSPERLDEAVAQISEIAATEGIELALCGGLAMQSYGSDRLTKDVDFVASGELSLPSKSPLTFGGSQVVAPNGVPVDIIVRGDALRPLYENALLHCVTRPGISCRVVSAEFLAAMKLAAGRPRDILDLHFLITSAISIPDARELVELYVGGWYAARDFDTHIEDAELEAARERKIRGDGPCRKS